MSAPIVIVTGPPGSGKTTLSSRLARSFPRGMHVPVDDLREWMVSGRSDPTAWDDETERQFQLAEKATALLARSYAESGVAVVVDHCRNLPRLDAWIESDLVGCQVVRILVLTDLETTLTRNRERTNKDFDPLVLEDVIASTHARYVADWNPDGPWIRVDGGQAPIPDSLFSRSS